MSAARLAVILSASLLLGSVAGPVLAQPRGFSLPGLYGGELKPEDLDRGTILLVVFAGWTPRCKDIVARVDALVDRWGSQASVIMVDFQEDRADVEEFLGDTRPGAPVYLDIDGTLSKRFAVTHLPGLVVLQDGNTRFSGRLTRTPDSIIAQTLD